MESKTTKEKALMRTTVTTSIVLGAFAICWLPMTAKFIVEEYSSVDGTGLFVRETIAEVFLFGNSVVNPIIYGLRNDLFRKTYLCFIRSLCCGRCHSNDKEQTKLKGSRKYNVGSRKYNSEPGGETPSRLYYHALWVTCLYKGV
ncbi:putative pyroglutamylated RFamide peptide receptor [Apostichopus japonicus]|uniref:Putative pyroglutamylated RFamide peptide receptor n=1 Tax=Stichopus japonicus TaxID=307972 RepID=A0A2G8KVP8_STIJA|nr:putative pyroglutamylated RFamide peptide receptor [Apostichopus japonicus]